LPVVPRRASRRPTHATTSLVDTRASRSTPPTSTSPREDTDNEVLKKKYLQKAKIKERVFLTSLSDLDHDYDNAASSSSDEETERQIDIMLLQ
jgi:hypothetical protein